MGAYGSPDIYPHDNNEAKKGIKPPVFKKWWFWVLVVVGLLFFVAAGADQGALCFIGICVGFFGFLINFLFVFVKLIRKQSPKKVFKRGGAFFFLFFVSIIVFPKSTQETQIADGIDKLKVQAEVGIQEKGLSEEPPIQETKKEEESSVEYIDVDYIDMWSNYTDEEYKDKNVRIVGLVNSSKEKDITIKDGLEGLTGSVNIALKEASEIPTVEGDYITVVGRVDGKLAGYLYLKDCNLEDISKEVPEKVIVYQNERIKEEKSKKEEYKSKAEVISYDALVRNPEKYEGHIMYVDLNVSQVLIGGIIAESGYAGKEGKDEWYVQYDLSEGESRILEGDKVRFYGEFSGLAEMKRAFTGTKVLIPRLKAQYRD